MEKALPQRLRVFIIWLSTDVSSIRGQAYMVANRATLTHSYIINQTETLSYRDTMRQFIVQAICYHDSTPALMLDGTRHAHECKNASTNTDAFSTRYHPQKHIVIQISINWSSKGLLLLWKQHAWSWRCSIVAQTHFTHILAVHPSSFRVFSSAVKCAEAGVIESRPWRLIRLTKMMIRVTL